MYAEPTLSMQWYWKRRAEIFFKSRFGIYPIVRDLFHEKLGAQRKEGVQKELAFKTQTAFFKYTLRRIEELDRLFKRIYEGQYFRVRSNDSRFSKLSDDYETMSKQN